MAAQADGAERRRRVVDRARHAVAQRICTPDAPDDREGFLHGGDREEHVGMRTKGDMECKY